MRTVYVRLGLLAATLWVIAGASVISAANAPVSAISPAEALTKLMRGNARFQSGENERRPSYSKRRGELVSGQTPFAVILSCSDSRVPPEIIFDQGLGDLFVVRVAGNTVTRAGIESIDYAVTQLGANLIFVLGHEKCGAVKGAIGECSSKPVADLPEIFSNICPAVAEARKKRGSNLEASAIDLNVLEQVNLLRSSPQFRKRVADGSLKIVGARYNLASGKVKLLDAGN